MFYTGKLSKKVSCHKQIVRQHSCHTQNYLTRVGDMVDHVTLICLMGYSLITMQNLVTVSHILFFRTQTKLSGLPRWLSWLRHSTHRPGRSVGGAGVQSPGRPVDFVFGYQGRML